MIDNKRISPDARIGALAEMVGKCDCFADVGTDHGRLGAYLLQSHFVKKAILTDISADSLMKARKLIRLLGLERQTEFHVCDGIPKTETEMDCVVIAGMGGVLIADILKNAKKREELHGTRLILQPNVAQPHLRQALEEIGYCISDERIVKDGRRYYTIIEARPGSTHYSEEERFIGPILLKQRSEELYGYADFRIRVLEKALVGARQGNDPENISLLEKELELWRTLKD